MGKPPRCLQPGKGILPKGSWELPLVSQLQGGPGVQFPVFNPDVGDEADCPAGCVSAAARE